MCRFRDDLKENSDFFFNNDVACIDKALNKNNLYSNVLIIMVNRMLKLIILILKHRLQLDTEMLTVFHEISELIQTSENDKDIIESNLTASFKLTSRRISLIKSELQAHEIEMQFKQKLQPILSPANWVNRLK